MIGHATEAGDGLSDPGTGAPVGLGVDETDRIDAGPFDNPASYDETAAEVGKDREVLVGDDPVGGVVESNRGAGGAACRHPRSRLKIRWIRLWPTSSARRLRLEQQGADPGFISRARFMLCVRVGDNPAHRRWADQY